MGLCPYTSIPILKLQMILFDTPHILTMCPVIVSPALGREPVALLKVICDFPMNELNKTHPLVLSDDPKAHCIELGFAEVSSRIRYHWCFFILLLVLIMFIIRHQYHHLHNVHVFLEGYFFDAADQTQVKIQENFVNDARFQCHSTDGDLCLDLACSKPL